MAEILLSFGVQKLWDLLVSDRFRGVDEQLTELKSDLNLLRSFLKDANAMKHEIAVVRNCVEEIKEIVFDAEDIIETFLLKEETSGIRNSVRRFSKRRGLAFDMKAISKRISVVIRDMQTFGVQQMIDVDGIQYSHSLQEIQREMRETYPSNNENDLVGLEENVKKLVGYLVEEDSIQVVSITGMGGIGKTSLALQVFNHDMVKNHFDGVVWVCISQQFTRKYVWQTILQKLSSNYDEHRVSNMSEDELQDKLFRLLETSNSLIVLDDIWKEEDWNRIKPVFPSRKGWKVLLTSRNEGVGLRADPTCFTFKLDCLTPEESWKLFLRIAFPRENSTEYKVDEEMEKMGKQMIKHCGGLPLAIKVLGGLLAVKYTLHEWKRVYENIRSHIVGGTSFDDRNISSVYRILHLSFEELPIYLKHCFLYLAHFPDDYSIDVGNLSYYWAAEGIARPRYYNGATIREVADGYMEELMKRNMVISKRDVSTSRYETCHLHDMMREVCLRKAEEENFVQIVDASTSTATSHSPCKSRRLVIHFSNVTTHMEGYITNPKLRSLLVIKKQFWESKRMASGLCFTRLKLMRVLDLSTVEFEGGKLPFDIGKLIHLRYLSLYRARVSHLPSSMRNLKLLLYLNLNVEVGPPLYVPNILKEMQELRYLCLPDELHDTSYLELSDLINLETLENFSIKHSSMRDLHCMRRLKTLSILFTGGCNRKTLSSSLDELRHIENITIRDHSADTSEVLLDSTTCEALKENPHRNPGFAVTTKMFPAAVTKYRKEITKYQESECILVFSCNDSHDVEESHFVEAILKELHARAVTPLMYNLSGRENLNAVMLNRSSVGIMVLSDSYVCSKQSLDHLVAIMEHWKAKGIVIIPIYFKVTLEDICGLKGRFEAEFFQLQSSVQAERVQKWKTALAEIASIDGHEWTKGTQVMLAEEVVRDACLRLYLKDSKNLDRILALLNHSHSSDAEIVGIWGMAGIGKTAIAREIFRILAPQYDLCYFLQDFDLTCQKKGLRQMRDDFFSKIFGEEKLSISASDVKPSFMRNWFHKKTILVVLDDVSNARDAEAVVGGFGWFSHGHRIILTSRRKQVLVQCKVKEPYEIQKLWEFESSRLCKQYLNGENAVIAEVMSCSSGIPLALEVLGSSVSKQLRNNMKEHLQSLRRNPPSQIQEAFRRSFDELDENQKNIFLDLACFFTGENKDHVVQLLDACGFFTYLGICDLIDESLISLVDNRIIKIPIPFQDMGRFIVHEEDKDPSERSRLWDSKDIVDVLTQNSGTEAIEGIFLDVSDLTCELSPSVFSNMYRLRLLKFYCSTSGNQCNLSLSQGLDTLPDELRLLHWENYPLQCLPENFIPENLVEVNMPYSNMEKLWEGKKNLKKLKRIKLSHSENLTDILVLTEAINVEHIDLEGCTSLVDVSTSIPHCGKLVSLNMKDCSHLRNLPAMFELTSLEILSMSGCSELEEIQDFSPNLKELYLAGTAIRELPLSIENLTKLVTLDLENCKRLQKLPNGINNLESLVELKLSGCTSLDP